jgi:hypothetical protein
MCVCECREAEVCVVQRGGSDRKAAIRAQLPVGSVFLTEGLDDDRPQVQEVLQDDL